MAKGLSTILTFVCIVAQYLEGANGADNIFCHQLDTIFPNCECSSAPVETRIIYPIVDCSSRKLTQVPLMQGTGTYDKIIYKFILRDNDITTLTDASFQGLKIEYVDLTGNKLNSVSENAFLSMKDDLRTLEIEGNGNSKPPKPALQKLNVIQSLTMRNYNVPILEPKDNYFLSFVNLKSLTLDTWNINHIEASSFLGLDRLESLTLLNQKLPSLPIDGLRDDPFNNLETLRISNNPIKKVTHSVFSNLSKLKHLDLSNNQIDELEVGCFVGVKTTLQNINLKRNVLSDDQGKLDGLSGMEALETLDLSENTFQTIPSMPNLGVKKPLRLLLNYNEISRVPEMSFTGYGQHLKDLYLSANFIRRMDYRSFNGVTQLNSIYLQSQRGTDPSALELPISLTDPASTLQTMNLSGQKVDPVSLWAVVGEMTALASLNLNSAELQSIPDNAFEKVTALEHLDLSHNALQSITQNSLAGARQLKELDLVGNGIQTIPSCLFHGFLSTKISLALAINPIVCDCKIRQLVEDNQSGRIDLLATLGGATCKDGTLITSLETASLPCEPGYEEDTCIEYYTTTTPAPTEPVTNPGLPTLELTLTDISIHTMKASWTLSDIVGLQKFRFHVSSANNVAEFNRDNLLPEVRNIEAIELPANTHLTVCVKAYFNNIGYVQDCKVEKTLSDQTPSKEDLEGDDSDSATTGIIVGCVVAGVALIGIVIAVVILLVVRKKPKQVPDSYRPTTQPRSFAKAELPSMSDESRTFAKPKKNGKGSSPRNNNNSMQVVAISDGQTSPGARVGRVNMMFQHEDGYEPMSDFKKKHDHSTYENDHGALPPTPGPDQDSRPPSYPGATGGYYNQGYNEDKYDQIEVEI